MLRTEPLLLLLALVEAGCLAATPQGRAAPAGPQEQASARRISITATKRGFDPVRVAAKNGETVTLVFTRISERTCAKDVIVYLSNRDRVQRDLPLNVPVELALTFTHAGEVGYACSMNMLGGAIEIR